VSHNEVIEYLNITNWMFIILSARVSRTLDHLFKVFKNLVLYSFLVDTLQED